MMQLFLTDT